VDDILATGKAQLGLLDISRQAGAAVAGIGVVIEKGFQEGGELIRSQGVRVESLAIIDSMDEEKGIVFRN
jgi:xanthine phosphoribosyltransferase